MTTNGVGIKRYIAARDLTQAEFDYIEKMGNRQFINYLSPFLLGIQNIKINKDLSFNFSFRHVLTPFGDERSVDLFVNWKQRKIQFTPHIYSSETKAFPGIELGNYDVPVRIGKNYALLGGSLIKAMIR